MIGTCPKSACLLLGHSCSHNRALRVGPHQPQGNSILRSPQLSSCLNLRYQLLISAAVSRGDQDATEQRSSSRQNGPGGRISSRTSGRGGRNTRGGRGARKSPDASEQEASTNYNPPIDPPRMKVNRASRRAAERELAAAETAERDSRGGSSSHELPTGQDHANGSDRVPVEKRGGRGGRGRPSGRGGRGGRGRTSGAQNDGRRSMPPSQQKPAQVACQPMHCFLGNGRPCICSLNVRDYMCSLTYMFVCNVLQIIYIFMTYLLEKWNLLLIAASTGQVPCFRHQSSRDP
jgi:hypothetical protein